MLPGLRKVLLFNKNIRFLIKILYDHLHDMYFAHKLEGNINFLSTNTYKKLTLNLNTKLSFKVCNTFASLFTEFIFYKFQERQ